MKMWLWERPCGQSVSVLQSPLGQELQRVECKEGKLETGSPPSLSTCEAEGPQSTCW